MQEHITIGLMSGTSLDGTDAVAVRFSSSGMQRLGHAYDPFPPSLRHNLAALTLSGEHEIDRMGDASVQLVKHYAKTVDHLLSKTGLQSDAIAAIGVHGQTIRHRPERHFSVQLNYPALLAELTDIDVIADFRSRDIAAGGEGAPLVPAFHAECFTGDVTRVILNLGGIANISILPPKTRQSSISTVLGGDTGPANMLLDTWSLKSRGLPYDEGGLWASKGRISSSLLRSCLDEPYFSRSFPKSTGRELFSPEWLNKKISSFPKLPAEDIARTLTELTAVTVTNAVRELAPDAEEMILCGGGSFNHTLVTALKAHFAGQIFTTEHFGIKPMEVEAAAFAWLASRFLQRLPGNLPAVTHATGPRILGALYPAH